MRFGAFVITFNRPLILKNTLQCILEQTKPPDLTLVVDNGNSGETKAVAELFTHQNVIYHAMKENLGPAGASAYALQWLVAQGFDWIYWGDEDDPPQFANTLERVLAVALENDSPNLGAVGAVGALFDWKKGESVRLPDHKLKGAVSVDSIGGNSQLIVRKEVIRSVGVPDARLFFGYYEPEYCLRIRRAGFRLLVDGDLMWKHREKFGRLNLERQRALISVYPYEIIWRRYYRTRNYIFMMRETFGRPDLARKETIKAIFRALFSWVRGFKYGYAFTRLQLRGVFDGYCARMGRTILPKPKTT